MAKTIQARNRTAPAPEDDPFGFDPCSFELSPGSFALINDWMHVAVRKACGRSGTLEDVATFALVWNLTHTKDGEKKPGEAGVTHCSRAWLAAKTYRAKLDTVSESVNFLVEAGLITKEFSRTSKVVHDPETGRFIRTASVTTDWELSTVDDSPAIQYALAWEAGRIAEQEAARAAKTPRQVLETVKASLGEFIDALQDEELALLVDSDGHPNMQLFAALFSGLSREMGADDAPQAASEGPAEAVSAPEVVVAQAAAERGSQDDWEALKAATVNRNKLDEAEGEYWALRAEGYSADEVSRAWARAQAKIDDDRYKPQLLKWLMGEGSMAGKHSARAMLDKARRHPVRIDPSAVLDDFDPLTYAAIISRHLEKPDD